jgi:hypothetical protein
MAEVVDVCHFAFFERVLMLGSGLSDALVHAHAHAFDVQLLILLQKLQTQLPPSWHFAGYAWAAVTYWSMTIRWLPVRLATSGPPCKLSLPAAMSVVAPHKPPHEHMQDFVSALPFAVIFTRTLH